MVCTQRRGPDIPSMNDPQLLTHLLGMAGLDATAARELSHALLQAHQDLEHVLALPQARLLGYPGLGEGAATFLLLLTAMLERYRSPVIQTDFSWEDPEDVRAMLAPHFPPSDHERVCAFLLDERRQPITTALVGQGDQAAVTFSIRRVLDLALNHRAGAVVLVHNHPDCSAAFSQCDIETTGQLMQELALVEVALLDHYLIAGQRLVSLRQYIGGLQHNIYLSLLPAWFPAGMKTPGPV